MKKTWAVIGGGNGGQAMAGHLAVLGERVRLFDVVQATVDALNAKGCIEVHRAVEGCGKIEFATTDMAKAMDGADVVMVILPSIYYESIARKIIPNLKDGQVVFLHPEASCGALAFRKIMKEMNCTADVVVGAACTLLYSTRVREPGIVDIFGQKSEVAAAALPATDNPRLMAALHPELPWFKEAPNVVVTSLENLNALMHPAPVLFSISRVEAEPFVPFQYYLEGLTPSIGKYIEAMDAERVEIAHALGLSQRTIRQEYVDMYHCGDVSMPLYQLVRNNPGYIGVQSASTIATRYTLEDIPYSLEAIRSIAKVVGVPTPCIDAIITIGHVVLGEKMDEGRTPEALGIQGMDRETFLKYVNG